MLFTVNVETIGQLPEVVLADLAPGYSIKSLPFVLNKGKLGYENNLPHESETGLEVIPGKIELDTLIELFEHCVKFVGVTNTVLLGYKKFSWPGHVFANTPIYVQYSVLSTKPRLMCSDITWLCELKDSNDKTACQITIQQRLYLA